MNLYIVEVMDSREDDRNWFIAEFPSLAKARNFAKKESLNPEVIEAFVSQIDENITPELAEYYSKGKLSIKVI